MCYRAVRPDEHGQTAAAGRRPVGPLARDGWPRHARRPCRRRQPRLLPQRRRRTGRAPRTRSRQLRELAKPERFRYAPPFRPVWRRPQRRFDRGVARGLGGPRHGRVGNVRAATTAATAASRSSPPATSGSTASIGGDHAELARRRFASRMTTYLILRAIDSLTPGTKPEQLPSVTMTTVPGPGRAALVRGAAGHRPGSNWTTEGVSGGAYNKVIRWAFEKQGCTSPPGARHRSRPRAHRRPSTSTSTTAAAASTRSRRSIGTTCRSGTATRPTAGSGHQTPTTGVTNYVYVKVKNRGTTAATNVDGPGYHSLPGAGLTWPTDFRR